MDIRIWQRFGRPLSTRRPAGRSGSLTLKGLRAGDTFRVFGGKYQADFEARQQCDAFAKGVEVVLIFPRPIRRRGRAPRATAGSRISVPFGA